jgi:hypothetical protein
LVKKWNSTVSSTFAINVFGVYVKPFSPTLTTIVAAKCAGCKTCKNAN